MTRMVRRATEAEKRGGITPELHYLRKNWWALWLAFTLGFLCDAVIFHLK